MYSLMKILLALVLALTIRDALEKPGTAAAGSDGGSEDKTEAAEPENKADDKPADDKQDEGGTGLSDDDTPITDWSKG